MTNATDELHKLLDKYGIEYLTHYWHTFWRVGSKLYDAVSNVDGTFTVDNLTPEQAIAATLRSDAKPCYATDYTHGHCKYSGNRGWTEDTKFHIPTPRHGTLTAKQVREAAESNSRQYESPVYDGVWSREYDWQAIADELNVAMSDEECELEEVDTYNSSGEPVHVLECSACGKTCEHVNGSYPRCPHCGRKAVKR